MGEQSNTIPPKGIFTLKKSDFVKGLAIVSFGSISAVLIFLTRQDHWPSWHEWQPYIEVTVTTFLTYIGKNYFTNNTGEVFAPDKPTTTVPTKELKEVVEQANEAK